MSSDLKTTEELVRIALSGLDDDSRSDAVWLLRERGSLEVFETAKQLCGSAGSAERTLGVQILCQLNDPENCYRGEIVELLLGFLETERDENVLCAAGWGVGHLALSDAVPALIRLKNHHSPIVRSGVVGGLLGQESPCAIEALIGLCLDVDDDVRNWSTFGLGTQTTQDSPAIRDALLNRLDDPNDEIRDEAMYGLAARGDQRVLELVRKALLSRNALPDDIRAAASLSNSELVPALLRLKEEQPENAHLIENAIQSCNRNPSR